MNIFQSTVVLWHFIAQFVHRHILGHSHLVGYFGHRDLTFYLRLLLSIDYEAIDTLGLVFSAYLDDLRYLPTFILYSNISPLIFSCFLYYQSLIITFFLSHTSHHNTWPHTPLLIRRKCRSVIDFFGCAFNIFWTLDLTSSMMARSDRLLIY